MSWDASKPPNSGYLQSAEVRANWAAIADQALGRNLLGDPEYKIWGGGTTGNAPSWWNLTGQTSDGNISRAQSSTTITIPGANSATKLTYAANLKLWQNVLSTGDMTTSVKAAFAGQAVSAGVFVYTDSNACKLVIHGPTSDVVSSAIGTGAWKWVKKSHVLVSSDLDRLGMGVEIKGAGDAYVACPTLVLGPIPPDYYVPGVATKGVIATVLAGDPIDLTTDADGAWSYTHHVPFTVERVDIKALTAVTTNNLIIDCMHDTGTCWASIYSATSDTTKPQLSATCSVKGNGAVPDGNYTYRCFDADPTGLAGSNTTINLKVIQVAGTGGKNATVSIRALSYQPPLQGWRLIGNYK